MGALTRNSLSRPPWNELMTWVRPTDIMEALRRMSKRVDIFARLAPSTPPSDR